MDSEAPYVKLLDSMTVGFITVNLKWEISFSNKEAERITKFTKKEATG